MGFGLGAALVGFITYDLRSKSAFTETLSRSVRFANPVTLFFISLMLPVTIALAPRMLFPALAGPALLAWMWAWHLSRRAGQPSASEKASVDSRSPVLMLRPFSYDDSKVSTPQIITDVPVMTRRVSYEASLSRILERVGPVIALGAPCDRLPPVGAARDYVSREDWMKWIKEKIPTAALVVVIYGETPNLGWELDELEARGALPRLLLLFLVGASPSIKGRLGLRGIAVDMWDTSVWGVAFDAQSRPCPLRTPDGQAIRDEATQLKAIEAWLHLRSFAAPIAPAADKPHG